MEIFFLNLGLFDPIQFITPPLLPNSFYFGCVTWESHSWQVLSHLSKNSLISFNFIILDTIQMLHIRASISLLCSTWTHIRVVSKLRSLSEIWFQMLQDGFLSFLTTRAQSIHRQNVYFSQNPLFLWGIFTIFMVERSVRIREVKGSNPSGSTKSENPNLFPIGEGFGFFHEEENTIHGSSKGIAALEKLGKRKIECSLSHMPCPPKCCCLRFFRTAAKEG